MNSMPQRSEFERTYGRLILSDRQKQVLEKVENDKVIRISALVEASRKVMVDSESGWYCLKVKPQCEFGVDDYLSAHDVETFLAFLPSYETKERGRVKVVPRRIVMPGLLPVRCPRTIAAFRALLDVPDVSGFIGEPKPHRMRDSEINRFKASNDNGSLAKLVADIRLKVGDPVFVKAGIFVDMRGALLEIADASAVVSMDLGKVTMPLAFLEKL